MHLHVSISPTVNMAVTHGPIKCSSCFPEGSAAGCTLKVNGWRIDNNPGYWGAAEPEVLVLGFSKGANQRSALPFDEIAFNNARSNLAEILAALALVDSTENIDVCFTSEETKIGFASVIRCGLGQEVEPGKYVTSGNVVRSAIAPSSPVRRFFDACTKSFLGVLPPSARVVVFLGLDGLYIEALFQRVKQLHPSVRRLSKLAYRTDTVTFVHAIHPSPLATSHRQKWLRNDDSLLASKRREAMAALGDAMDEKPEAPSSFRSANERMISKPRRTVAVRHSIPRKNIEDLIELVRDALNKGTLVAKEIKNRRSEGDEVKKVIRLQRGDGEEFAILQTGKSIRIWSSAPPKKDTPLAEPAEHYAPDKSRHSNLGVMAKLRGPSKDGTLGASAWKLRFHTPLAALNFIMERSVVS
jgi:hypothetical protein